mmetsp:Transcript_87510/g.141717  ORF Transcript_87510/g.141717 Transcript_87510/m.141717 type:complete len:80 (+) Transcript_87510:2369-2608(+)
MRKAQVYQVVGFHTTPATAASQKVACTEARFLVIESSRTESLAGGKTVNVCWRLMDLANTFVLQVWIYRSVTHCHVYVG